MLKELCRNFLIPLLNRIISSALLSSFKIKNCTHKEQYVSIHFATFYSQSHFIYRIVASRSTCYYSENQIFLFLKSRIVTCRKFFLGTKLFCLLSKWAEKKGTWQTHDVFVKYLFFQLIRTTFIFWPPMLLIEFNSISNMGCH